MKHKKLIYISLGVIGSLFVLGAIAFGIIYLYIWLIVSKPSDITSEYKESLPKTATDIKEKFEDLYPDWTYFLKAKIEKDEYEKYAQDMKLNEDIGAQFRRNICYPSEKLEWWNPKLTNWFVVRTKYIYRDKEKTQIIYSFVTTYENGYLYLAACKY